ncbi:MAG: 2-oxoacid:acceptor oxidoreductase family protein [Oscillospiraceae bacterium]|jgi:pyruvate ferredoxin oxidoreductase gamma subunit|nr:2-oxoacid:acceptor oxidoreductase family protein [Oscillospiraceae bacterium]
MTEILWHGRGGQGAFTAARILGAAAVRSGGYALAFPSFGPERRGAPMRAFTKLDESPISDRSEIALPSYTVYLDETLAPDALSGSTLVPNAADYEIAARHRLPTVNTVMLARLAQTLGFSREAIIGAIDDVMPEKIRKRNAQAVSEVMA